MLRAVESITLFVPDVGEAVAWYRTVFRAEPSVVLEGTAAFNLGDRPDFLLVQGDVQPRPTCAAMVCDNLDEELQQWRRWAGIVHAELLGGDYPVRSVILSDPWGNFLVVLESAVPNPALRPSGEAATDCLV